MGTFIVVVLATGSVVIYAKMNNVGYSFHCICSLCRCCDRDVSICSVESPWHFNPAVTLGFQTTKHITKRLLLLYFTAEITGALLGSLFVKYAIGRGIQASLGANSPNYSYPLPLIFAVEVLDYASLMAVILIVIHHTNGLKGFGGLAIGGIVGLDIFFLAFIAGVSMNPACSLACFIIRTFWKSMDISDCHVCWNINNSNCF
jgi:aquaporin Z